MSSIGLEDGQPSFDLAAFNLESFDLDNLLLKPGNIPLVSDLPFSSDSIPSLKPITSPTGVLPNMFNTTESFPLVDFPLHPPAFEEMAFVTSSSDGGISGSGDLLMDDSNTNEASGTNLVLICTEPNAPTTTKGKKTRQKRDPEEVKERIRAKNRRAQARYREKLKAQRNGTKTELEMVQEEVERLRLENTDLQGRNNVMSKVLAVREGVAGILESSTDKSSVTGLLPQFAHHLKSQLQPAVCSNSHQNCPLTGLSLAEVRAIKGQPAEAVAERFRFYVDKLKENMPVESSCCHSYPTCDCPADPNTPLPEAPTAIKDILFDLGCLCFENAIHNPTSLQKLLAAHLDNSDLSDPAIQQKWQKVTAALKLSPDQRTAMQPHRQRFEAKMEAITSRRRQLLGSLGKATVPTSLGALQDATVSWLELNETSTDLTANLQEEHVACMEMLKNAFGGVLTPMQKAVAMMTSYPTFPDIYSIAKAAEVEAKGLSME